MKYITEVAQRDELISAVVHELKSFGIKIPKIKKCQSKQDNKAITKLFGTPISSLPSVVIDELGTQVPKFLHECTSIINKNLDFEGLFRLAGSIVRQKELRKNLENGESLQNLDINIYDLGNLLKQFFRELPEPVITSRLHDHFIKAQNLDDAPNRVYLILLLCLLLPLEHLFILRYTMQLLANVAVHCDRNKMDVYNLAVIMAPNLMHNNEKAEKGIKNLQTQTDIINVLIHYSERIGMIPMTILERFSPLNNNVEQEPGEPLKEERKRRSSINGVFRNLRKKVANSRTPSQNISSLQLFTYNTPLLNEQKALLKRKAEEELLGTPAKKHAGLNARVNEIMESPLHGPLSTPCVLKTTQEHLDVMRQTSHALFSLESPSFHFTKKESLDLVSPFRNGNCEIQKTPKEKTKHKRFFSPLKLPKRSRKLGMSSPRISFRKQQIEKNPKAKVSVKIGRRLSAEDYFEWKLPLKHGFTSSLSSSALLFNCSTVSSVEEHHENKRSPGEVLKQEECESEMIDSEPVIIINNLVASDDVVQEVINPMNNEGNNTDEDLSNLECLKDMEYCENSQNSLICPNDIVDDGSVKSLQENSKTLYKGHQAAEILTPITAVCNQLDSATLVTPKDMDSLDESVEMKNDCKKPEDEMKNLEIYRTEEANMMNKDNAKTFISKRIGSKSLREKRKSIINETAEINTTNAALKRTYSEYYCSPHSLQKTSLRRGRPNTVHSGLPQPSPFRSLETLNNTNFSVETTNKIQFSNWDKGNMFQEWLKDNDIFLEERKTNSIHKLKQEMKVKQAEKCNDNSNSFLMSSSSDLNGTTGMSFEDFSNDNSANTSNKIAVNTISSWSSLGSVLSSSSLSIKDETNSTNDVNNTDEDDELGKLQLSEDDDEFKGTNMDINLEKSDVSTEINTNGIYKKEQVVINEQKINEERYPLQHDVNIYSSDVENKMIEANLEESKENREDENKSHIYAKNATNLGKNKMKLHSKLSNAKVVRCGLRNTPHTFVKLAPLTTETQSILLNADITQEKPDSGISDVLWHSADTAIENTPVSSSGRPSLIRLKMERAGIVSANVLKYNSITGKDLKMTRKNTLNNPSSPLKKVENKEKTFRDQSKRIAKSSSSRKSTSSPNLPMTEFVRRHSFRASKYNTDLASYKACRSSPSVPVICERKLISPKQKNCKHRSEDKIKISHKQSPSNGNVKKFSNRKVAKSSSLVVRSTSSAKIKYAQNVSKYTTHPSRTMTKQISAPI